MPTDYSNDPFDFSVGTLWSADGDGNYTKIGEVSDIKTFECVDNERDKNSMLPSVSRQLDYNKSLSFTCTISNKSRKKIINLFEYGWKVNGPVRKRLLRRLCLKTFILLSYKGDEKLCQLKKYVLINIVKTVNIVI
jgi:hypothetical protein